MLGAVGFALAVLFFDRGPESADFTSVYPEVDTKTKEETSLVEEPSPEVAPVPLVEGQTVLTRSWELEPGDVVEDVKNPRLLRHYGSETRTGKEDLEMVASVIQRFWMLFKNPDLMRVGSNEDLLKTLLGGNPEGVAFVSADNEFIDEAGRLLDRWGSPLFFHAESMTQIEIRSSGPDRERYTEDDILVRAGTTPTILRIWDR